MIRGLCFAMLLSLLSPASGSLLRAGAPKAGAGNQTAALAVAALRDKLAKVSTGLTTVLDAQGGALKDTKVAASLRAFTTELRQVLQETAGASDDKSLKRLQDAQAGTKSLVRDLTLQQVRLMKESDDQQQSLLLGVLMTRQSSPMEKQLEVLNSPDFRKLPVVAAILASKDRKTPLFKQVADYMDAHSPAVHGVPPSHLVGANGKPDVTPIVQALQARIRPMEQSLKRRTELHDKAKKELEASAKKQEKKNPKLAHRIRQILKQSDRQFAKEAALSRRDLTSLNEAVDAIKRGDMKALERSRTALQNNLKAMQSQNKGFLVLIQMAHRMEGLDCPYCAAQCVDKCHSGGNSYTTCLTQCADAGKGQ